MHRLSLFLAIAFASIASAKPMNIVLIVSDDHHYTSLGCFGDPVVKTPHLDRLAKDGVKFTHCFTPNPICTPSRACILTGQDTWKNGCVFFGEPINENSPLFPRLLSSAGYDVFVTGKWHNRRRPWDAGFTSGANIWMGGGYNHLAMPLMQWKQTKRSDRKPASVFASTAFADAAIGYLKSRDRAKPFCVYLSFTTPHDPWTPPGEYASMYDARKMPLPHNYMPRPPFKINERFLSLRDQRQLPWPVPKWGVKAALAQYYGLITQMDLQIGRVLDELDRQQLSDDTLVMFAGDHGYSMGSHGFVGKQTMYDEGIRTPLIVRHPKLKRGGEVSDALVSLMDLLPTMCDAAEVDTPKDVDGASLIAVYTGDRKHRRREIFSTFHSLTKHQMSTRCVRTQTHKYIDHLMTDETEMFDLITDPYELNNLAGKPEYKGIQDDLKQRLKAWRTANEKTDESRD